MCSSCGGKAAARLPGATPNNPVVFGEADGQAAQPATFLETYGRARAGQYRYVAGDGVAKAVEDGIIEIGYRSAQSVGAPRRKPAVAANAPEFYVKTSNNRWIGFTSKPAAERYANTVGGTVQTAADVLKQRS